MVRSWNLSSYCATIGLSALQYKDAYKTNIYRAGHLNLPKRMENILAHRDDIQYVNVVTWVRASYILLCNDQTC